MDNKNIILALCEAKKEFKPIVKNKINPHFKSEYADLQSYLDSTQDSLCKHGLFVSQVILERGLVTTIHYAYSSDTIVSVIDLKECPTPQAFGSALTYYRRYAYSAILGLSSEDDDANESSVKAPAKIELKKVETKPEQKKETPIIDKIVSKENQEPVRLEKLDHYKKLITESKFTGIEFLKFVKAARKSLDDKYPDATDYRKCQEWLDGKILDLEKTVEAQKEIDKIIQGEGK